jgi:hypothetical protein
VAVRDGVHHPLPCQGRSGRRPRCSGSPEGSGVAHPPVCPASRRAIDSPGGCSGSCGRTAASTSTSRPPEGRPRLGGKGVEGVCGHPGRGADTPLAGSVERVLQDGARWWPPTATTASTEPRHCCVSTGSVAGVPWALAPLVLGDRAARWTLVERGGEAHRAASRWPLHARTRPGAGHRVIYPGRMPAGKPQRSPPDQETVWGRRVGDPRCHLTSGIRGGRPVCTCRQRAAQRGDGCRVLTVLIRNPYHGDEHAASRRLAGGSPGRARAGAEPRGRRT